VRFDREAALERLSVRAFDVVLLISECRHRRSRDIEAHSRGSLAMRGRGTHRSADYDDCVAAMKSGAFHYLCKPTEPALVEDTLRRAAEHLGLRRENAALRRMLRPAGVTDFVGESSAIRAVLDMRSRLRPPTAA